MNHLIIGLGGTGGRVIRSFRKTIYQSFRGFEPQGVNVDYLYVDSDDRMMGLTDSTWKSLGHNVQLDPRNQLVIKSADLTKCLEDLQSYGNLRPWLGTRDQWKDILSGIADATIGGQKRRLGRFLFARGIDDFDRKLNEIVRDLRNRGGNDRAVTFHIVCGLAGGTGSGSVIDAITQVRRTYQFDTGHTYPVVVYALLPDRVPKNGWNTGNYWANGYAALMELNALGLDWQPVDLKSPLGANVARQRQFDGCYVFSNENEFVSVDVETEMPDIIASFLYQKTVMVQDSKFHQLLGSIEACENGDASPEYDDSKSGPPQRSRYFLTFGVRRLAYPEEEIQEYISYTFGLQAAHQLAFNNWIESVGFADRELPWAPLAEARRKELLERWKLTDEHLLLSRGILQADAADKSWKLLHNEWHDLIPRFREAAMEGVDRNWLLAAKELFERRFQTGFRKLGVVQFYATRLSARNAHCAEICGEIERHLFDEWATGDRAMRDVARLLDALLADIELRKKASDKRAGDLAAEIDELNAQIAGNEAQWAKVGLFGQYVLKHRHRLLDAQCLMLANYYERQTLREANSFGLALLKQLLQDLGELGAHVARLAGRIAQVMTQYQSDLGARLRDGAQREGAADGNDQIVRFYDRSNVIRVTDTMKLDAAIQRTSTGEVRKAIVRQLGEARSFGRLDDVMSVGALRDVIDRTCSEFSKSVHDTVAKTEQQKVLGVNIINKLRERYEGDEDGLRMFVQKVMVHANEYLVRDRNQQYPSASEPMKHEIVIIMPAADNSPFAKRLETALRNFAQGTVHLATSQTRRNEIVVISLRNLFPLRYGELSSYLRKKYEERLAADDATKFRHEIHTEGDGTQFPSLFRLTGIEVSKKALPYYLLGHALGLFKQSANARGTAEWALIYKEGSVEADPIYLGRTLTDAQVRLESHAILHRLRQEVGSKLSAREYRSDEARTSVTGEIGDLVRRVLSEVAGDRNDEVFRAFRDAGKTAIEMIRQEA